MAVLAAILPVVSRSSCLALELYQFAASSPGEAKDLVKVAKAINNFASILKQVGTIIKEDDRLPSYEVCYFPQSAASPSTSDLGLRNRIAKGGYERDYITDAQS